MMLDLGLELPIFSGPDGGVSTLPWRRRSRILASWAVWERFELRGASAGSPRPAG
ncbi:hypothetical protein ACEUZ9_004583 [Paracoccus litorisediminis]|uniref:hypothetical protein n=1 Tax=Paracoccus litorisediminis TaxID=2006130 RepID=UPI0037342F33